MPVRTLAFRAAVVALVLAAPVRAQLGPFGNVLLTDAIPQHDAQFGEVIASGDFDGDGDADLAVAANRFGEATSDGRVTVFINDAGTLRRGWYGGEFTGEEGSGHQVGAALAACDFNGDGADELAVGVPNDDSVSSPAGAVRIYTLAPISGLDGFLWTQTQFLAQGDVLGSNSVEGDRLGSELACADFDNDDFDDLAIGVPEKEVGNVNSAGKVVVIYGRATGLNGLTDRSWTQDTVDDGIAVLDQAEDGDRFGDVLATGDFDRDGFADLAIGVPSEDRGSIEDTGAVHVLFGSADGLSAARQFLFDDMADDYGVGDIPQAGDRFGHSLAVGDFNRSDDFLSVGHVDLAIGAPYKDVGALSHAGYVYVLYGGSAANVFDDADGTYHADSGNTGQRNENFGYTLAAGNFDGDRQRDLAVGRPDRDIGSVPSAGLVTVFYGQPDVGLEGATTQSFAARPGYASAPYGHIAGYGAALVAADIDGDGSSDLAVGIRDQLVNGVEQAGAVQMIFTGILFADGLEE